MYGYLADAMVILHVGYVGYVVVGQLAIIGGAALRAEWARNPWFRWTHLLAIAVVGVEVGMNWECPLTTWEYQLRVLADGDFAGSGSFMGRIFHRILFWPDTPQIFFDTLHVATLVVVAQAFVMYPPRRFRCGKAA
jgi:hypothetical protein